MRFLFTFSRSTLQPDVRADPRESFVFSTRNGEVQCFWREREILDLLGDAGFRRDTAGPMIEYNVLPAAGRGSGGPPAIYEATFVRGRMALATPTPAKCSRQDLLAAGHPKGRPR